MRTAIVVAAVVLASIPAIAQAQQQAVYTEDERWVLNELQLIESLQSPIDGVREQALRNAIVFATLYRQQTELGQAVPALQAVYATDVQAQNRKLALAALQAIGSNQTRRFLARSVSDQESEEGRALVATVLSEYYAGRASAGLD